MTNQNPNDPGFPYGGGTDNPSGSTASTNPGGGVGVETGRPFTKGPAFYSTLGGGSDTNLGGLAAVPVSGAGFEASADYGNERATGEGPGSTTDPTREPGQDETAGATEVTPGTSPSTFPEPNP